MDAPWFASRTGAVLVGSESTANVGRGAGMAEERLRVIRGGEVFETGRFRITFIESRHGKALFGRVPFPGEIASPLRPPARASDYREGGTFSILVEHPCGSFVHNGSAGWVEGMFDDVRADVLFLGLAGRETTIGLIENLVRPLAPRMVVPFHFDDFFTGLDETMGFLAGVGFEEFVAVIEREMPGLRLATLPIGRRIAILPVTPSCCR
jgi:L-ascorbate metabolism protein UlaG (beta-lactamase superfamily)